VLLKIVRYLLRALVLLLIFLGSALLSMRLAIHDREIEVPKLVGLTAAEAERVANSKGMVTSVANRFYSAEFPKGHVVAQMPQPKSTVRHGSRILISESLGPQKAAIPNVVGQSENAARVNLKSHGLQEGSIISVHFPEATPGTVIAQSPSHDSQEVNSPRVNLVLAMGDEVTYVMPSFTGKPLAEAAEAADKAGLVVANAPKPKAGEANTPALTGVVMKQYPPAGQKVASGDKVWFTVSRQAASAGEVSKQ
jgi:beta-lactam-binding protein with PASTA domain